MRRIGRIFLATVGGIAIVGTSFWVTLTFLQNRTPGIHVIEAAYGGSCKDYKVPPPRENKFAPGNATSTVASACDGKLEKCDFTVKVDQLGDPAPGCGKD